MAWLTFLAVRIHEAGSDGISGVGETPMANPVVRMTKSHGNCVCFRIEDVETLILLHLM